MSILITKTTRVLVQGITGTEGSRAAHDMIAYGTNVVAGVTPGKGGQRTSDGVPVFDTVHEARAALAQRPTPVTISASLIAVPAPFVLDAALEAIEHGIALVIIFTEKVPVHDVAAIIAAARPPGVMVVGPSSIGIISPGKCKIGSIGSGELAERIFCPGPIGVISKSGGMTAEISRLLTQAGWGQSTVLGIGGDVLVGTDFLDAALLFEQDRQTRALVIFGEVGGVYEEKLAEAVRRKKITKPIVALIAGRFAQSLPTGTVLGHAGAIVNQGRGSFQSKVRALKRAGAHLVQTPEGIPRLLKKVLR